MSDKVAVIVDAGDAMAIARHGLRTLPSAWPENSEPAAVDRALVTKETSA